MLRVVECSGSHFTGKERDTETGLDYFGARYYASNMGRWMSPDWADKPEAVPYSDLNDPQSLNLYGYVRNNPLSKNDLDGHNIIDSIINAIKGTPPPPPAPPAAAVAKLTTDTKGNTTTFTVGDKNGVHETQIETHMKVTSDSKPVAGGPIEATVKGVDDKHAGSKEYGPKGALIDVGDSRNRYIHGGGSMFGVTGSQADNQGWAPTYGCTRGQNIDVISLGKEITTFQENHPESPIPYVRE